MFMLVVVDYCLLKMLILLNTILLQQIVMLGLYGKKDFQENQF